MQHIPFPKGGLKLCKLLNISTVALTNHEIITGIVYSIILN